MSDLFSFGDDLVAPSPAPATSAAMPFSAIDLISKADLSKLTGLTPKDLDGMVERGELPAPFQMGGKDRWQKRKISAVINAMVKRASEVATATAAATAAAAAQQAAADAAALDAVPPAAPEPAEKGRGTKWPFPKLKGITVYKPRVRDQTDRPWLIAVSFGRGKPRLIETASPLVDVTRERQLEIYSRLERVRLGLMQFEDVGIRTLKFNGLTRHLHHFHTWLSSRGRTSGYADEVYSRTMKVVEWAKFQRLADLDATAVQAAVERYRVSPTAGHKTPRMHATASNNTCNKYLKAMRLFGDWLLRFKRVKEDPFAYLDLYPDIELIRPPRALSPDELSNLLAAAAAGPAYRKLSGADRRILYLVAVYTGLRKGELASLTSASFSLDANPPTVTVRASQSKNRKLTVLPLMPALVAELRAWLPGRPADGPLFEIPDKAETMIYADLEAAGIPRKVGGKVLHFHALRHTYGSLLADGGANITTIKDLMRHSDIRLTSRYVHAQKGDLLRAVAALPPIAPAKTPVASPSTADQTQIKPAADEPQVNESATPQPGPGGDL